MRRTAYGVLLTVGCALSGCGIPATAPQDFGSAPDGLDAPVAYVYLVHNGALRAFARFATSDPVLPPSPRLLMIVVNEVLHPTEEQRRAGVTSAVTPRAISLWQLQPADPAAAGPVIMRAASFDELKPLGERQLVCSITRTKQLSRPGWTGPVVLHEERGGRQRQAEACPAQELAILPEPLP